MTRELPQRPGAFERVGGDQRRQVEELAHRPRRGKGDPAHVEVDVEVRVVDPRRGREVDGRRLDPPPQPGHRPTARSMRARSRSKSGGRSRTDTVANVDVRYGSFSRRHIRPSASVILRSIAHGDAQPCRDPCTARGAGSARDGGVLELVEVGPHDLVEDPLDGARSPARRRRREGSSRRTKTAASPTMNVGTPQTLCDSTNAVCSFSTVTSGRPESTSAHTASTSAPRPRAPGSAARGRVACRRRRGGARTGRDGRRGTARAGPPEPPAKPAGRGGRCRPPGAPRPEARPPRRAPGRARRGGSGRPSRRRRGARRSRVRGRCVRTGSGSRRSVRRSGSCDGQLRTAATYFANWRRFRSWRAPIPSAAPVARPATTSDG